MKKKIFISVVFCISVILLSDFVNTFAVVTEYVLIVVNDDRMDTGDTEPEIINGSTYAPLRAFSGNLGSSVFWDDETFSAVVEKDGIYITVLPHASSPVRVNGGVVDGVTCYFKNDRLMLPYRFIAETFGYDVKYFEAYNIARVFDGNHQDSDAKMLLSFGDTALAEKNEFNSQRAINPIKQSGFVVGDDYRMAYNDVEKIGSLYVVGNVGFENLSISDHAAREYAGLVNNLAKEVPNVDTYLVLIPSGSEFYSPKEIFRDQTSSISKIYDLVSKDIIPINAVEPLYNRANEKIYFMTDHHWTQRGAYYAYKSFLDSKGENIDIIDSFETSNNYDFVGYWADFLYSFEGTNKLDKITRNKEMLERFMPKVWCEGMIYNNQYLDECVDIIPAVDPNVNAYITFIGGDNPVAVFNTSVDNNKSVCILKDSYGDAFATWALNNYSTVYIIDPRHTNGMYGMGGGEFKLSKFYERTGFDDLIILNYPGAVESVGYRYGLSLLCN